MAPPLAALRLLTPRSAILLLSQCICHRPRFLLRTASDLALVMPLARTFDEQICLAVENNLRMDRHDGARAQIFLPHHLGGMGIVRNSGMASEKGQLISRLALTEFLGQFYPNELSNLQLQHNFWPDIQLGQEKDLGHLTDIPASTIAGMTFRSSKAILALGKRTAATAAHGIALKTLADNGQLQTATNLLGYSASYFSFCFSTTGIDSPHYFSAGAFRCAVRVKLGVGPTSEALEPIRHCPCIIVYNTAIRTRRHHRVVQALAALIRHTQRGPVTIVTVVRNTASGGEICADLTWTQPEGRLIIDVAVVDPGADKYTKHPTSSHRNPDSATQAEEATKWAYYARIVPAPTRATIIPFALEATGRLGPSALAFLKKICRTHTYHRSQFLNDISMLFAISAGNMLKATRNWF